MVDGKSFSQTLKVRMDPRVKTRPLGLLAQFNLSMQAYVGIIRARNLAAEVHKRIADLEKSQPSSLALPKLKLLLDGPQQRPGTPIALSDFPLGRLSGAFTQLLDLLQDADVAPSTQAVAAARDLQIAMKEAESRWKELAQSSTR
jgi:hypothetical protein